MVPLAVNTKSSLKASRSVSSRDMVLTAMTLFLARYQFQNTKAPELIFSALLGNDGARDVHFDRALYT
jgi:hypothetical protein